MRKHLKIAKKQNRNLTHFGPEGNLFNKQNKLFETYGETGTGMCRYYVNNKEEEGLRGSEPGMFADWEPLPPDTDLLFYDGLHGGVVTDEYNICKQVDLLIGVAPAINLE
jgi:phosphoribulokinase